MLQTPLSAPIAHFELGLFHDNNSREAEAIPHYEAALELGLEGEQRARCLAWLASSLSKTGKPDEAQVRLAGAGGRDLGQRPVAVPRAARPAYRARAV